MNRMDVFVECIANYNKKLSEYFLHHLILDKYYCDKLFESLKQNLKDSDYSIIEKCLIWCFQIPFETAIRGINKKYNKSLQEKFTKYDPFPMLQTMPLNSIFPHYSVSDSHVELQIEFYNNMINDSMGLTKELICEMHDEFHYCTEENGILIRNIYELTNETIESFSDEDHKLFLNCIDEFNGIEKLI